MCQGKYHSLILEDVSSGLHAEKPPALDHKGHAKSLLTRKASLGSEDRQKEGLELSPRTSTEALNISYFMRRASLFLHFVFLSSTS